MIARNRNVIAVIGKAKAPLILGTHGKPGQAPGQVAKIADIENRFTAESAEDAAENCQRTQIARQNLAADER